MLHYQEITFEQVNEISFKSDYLNWLAEIEKIRLSRFLHNEKSDCSLKEIIDQ